MQCIPPRTLRAGPPDTLQSLIDASVRLCAQLHRTLRPSLHPSSPESLQSLIAATVPLFVQLRRYATRHDEIMETADTIFLDAGEEFASVASVKTALEEFKIRWVGWDWRVGRQCAPEGRPGAGGTWGVSVTKEGG